MANKKKCPYCGFIGRMISSDGVVIAYVCERCKEIFHEKVK